MQSSTLTVLLFFSVVAETLWIALYIHWGNCKLKKGMKVMVVLLKTRQVDVKMLFLVYILNILSVDLEIKN